MIGILILFAPFVSGALLHLGVLVSLFLTQDGNYVWVDSSLALGSAVGIGVLLVARQSSLKGHFDFLKVSNTRFWYLIALALSVSAFAFFVLGNNLAAQGNRLGVAGSKSTMIIMAAAGFLLAKERMTGLRLISLTLVFIGSIAVSWPMDGFWEWPIGLEGLAFVLWGLEPIFVKRVVHEAPILPMTFLYSLVLFLVLSGVGFILGSYGFDGVSSLKTTLSTAVLGFIFTGMGTVLYLVSLRKWGILVYSIFYGFGLILAPIVSVIFFGHHESIVPWSTMLLGSALGSLGLGLILFEMVKSDPRKL